MMDVWETLVAGSTLSEDDGDAWEHLTNPSGTVGETTRFIPYNDLVLDIVTGPMTVDIEKRILEIDIQTEDIDI